MFGAGAVAGAALNALGLHGKARGEATKGVKRWVRGALFAKDTDEDGAPDVVGIDSDGDGRIDAVTRKGRARGQGDLARLAIEVGAEVL